MPLAASLPTDTELCELRVTDLAKVRRARAEMKPAEAIALLAETFRSLGDPNRLRLVHALSRQELCVCDLAAALGMSQSAVSHSLRSLRQLRLVRSRKESKTTYYRLDDEHIARLLADGFEHVEERV
jgi:ArsR family transcriptional regulator, lead/cadmium/zinc/bismuth-responsive transcriptional repressor